MSLANQGGHDPDMRGVLHMLAGVMDRMTVDTKIGRIVMPGSTYLGMWARDTGISALGLNRLGKSELSSELLRRYWSFQITEESDPAVFVFRNKVFAGWTERDAFRPTRRQLRAEIGAFPTSVYLETPNFPAGTREIYGTRADLDSTAWLVIALHDCYCHRPDDRLLEDLAPQVERAIGYMWSRDADGDCLLEQGPNEDWADTLLRRGKVSYTQAVWFMCLKAAAAIFAIVGDEPATRLCHSKSKEVSDAINRQLLSPHGYYVDCSAGGEVSLRRSLDTALLVAFGVSEPRIGSNVLDTLASLKGPFGSAVVEPAYSPADIGPYGYRPGEYHNEGIWPWITSYLALAHASQGDREGARHIILNVLGPSPTTIHEWIDNLTGERHHPDFATGAGALAWAITEGGLGSMDLGEKTSSETRRE